MIKQIQYDFCLLKISAVQGKVKQLSHFEKYSQSLSRILPVPCAGFVADDYVCKKVECERSFIEMLPNIVPFLIMYCPMSTFSLNRLFTPSELRKF